jgi:hypothetical protein
MGGGGVLIYPLFYLPSGKKKEKGVFYPSAGVSPSGGNENTKKDNMKRGLLDIST